MTITRLLILALLVLAFQSYISLSYACTTFIQNPNKTQILQYFGTAQTDNVSGICSIEALSYYNKTGTLAYYNLSMASLTPYINHDINNFSMPNMNATAANSTIMRLNQTGEYCVRFTPNGNDNYKAQKAHVHKCNPGWIKNSQLEIDVTSPNTTLIIPNIGNVKVKRSGNYSAVGAASVTTNKSGSATWVGYTAVPNSNAGAQTVTSVSGSWVIQPALFTSTPRASAQWVGIGGTDGPMSGPVQIGTASCYWVATLGCVNIAGPSYGAFFECACFPPQANLLFMDIKPGDHISARVQLTKGIFTNYWQGTLTDQRTGATVIFVYIPGTLTTLVNSTAEWIDERPMVVYPLAYDLNNFVTTNFSNSYATINSQTGPISSFNYYNISMYSNSQPINDTSITSNFTGSGFEVHNFRVSQIFVVGRSGRQVTLEQGSPYEIEAAGDYATGTGIAGGTGPYEYSWLINYSKAPVPSNPKFLPATGCNNGEPYGTGDTAYCNVAADYYSQPGNYTYELEAMNNNVAGETVYSAPLTVQITPAAVSTVASYSISITNNQQATTAPFQQMLVIDSASYPGIAPNWDNVEFTTGSDATGTVLPAWVESNASSSSTHTIVWVKMPNGVPSGTTTIYMDVMPNAVMSASGPTGEAPQLSPSYGEYDNGAQVFNYYDNFAGSTSGWNSYAHNTSATANDGLSLTINGNGYFVTDTAYGPGTVFDTYITGPQDTQNIGYIDTSQPTAKDLYGNIGWTGAYIRAACGVTYADQVNTTNEANPCGSRYGTLSQSEGISGVYSVTPLSPTMSEQSLNYGAYGSVSIGAQNYPMPVGFSIMGLDKGTETIRAYWALVRTAPPNGVMPSYSFSRASDPISIISTSIPTSTTTTSTITTTGTTTSVTSTTSTTITPP